MCIPNRIGTPTHEVDLGYHRLRTEKRTQESPMEPPQGKERRRKKEREKEEKEGLVPYFAHKSCYFLRRDLVTPSCVLMRLDQRGRLHVISLGGHALAP
jgi:hypothetical protein